jgi:hypothetical protein
MRAVGDADGGDPFEREHPFGGSVPGADDDPFEREDPFGGSVPGADDDPFGGSVPGADDDLFDPVLPFAARLLEPPAPISATVATAASRRSFLFMAHSFAW